MSKELNLKSPVVARRPKLVRLLEDVQFFGINGKQVTEGQSGCHLAWNGEVVVVTNDNFPNQEKWLFPAGIMYLGWDD